MCVPCEAEDGAARTNQATWVEKATYTGQGFSREANSGAMHGELEGAAVNALMGPIFPCPATSSYFFFTRTPNPCTGREGDQRSIFLDSVSEGSSFD